LVEKFTGSIDRKLLKKKMSDGAVEYDERLTSYVDSSCPIHNRLRSNMRGLILGDIMRALKSLRFWGFVFVVAITLIGGGALASKTIMGGGYTLSNGREIKLFLYSGLPLQYGIVSSFNLILVFIFGAPVLCGDYIASDRQTGFWSLYKVRGLGDSAILFSRLVSSFLIVLSAGVLSFGMNLIGSHFFFSGSLAAQYTRSELIEVAIRYMPSVAQWNIWVYWSMILLIYVLMAWGVVCFCAIIGILTEQPFLAVPLPAAALILYSELTYNAYLSKQFCYFNYDFVFASLTKWSETKNQTFQLPLTILIFICGAYLSLWLKNHWLNAPSEYK